MLISAQTDGVAFVIQTDGATALGREGELALHVRAARTNGLSREEIGEVLLHTAVYAGVPAANAAFALAQRVLDEEDAGP